MGNVEENGLEKACLIDDIKQVGPPCPSAPSKRDQGDAELTVPAAQSGVLDKYGVELIGAKLPSIDRAEDRLLFKNAMTKIRLRTPESGTAESWEEAQQVSTALKIP